MRLSDILNRIINIPGEENSMKKLFLIILSALLIVSCRTKEIETKAVIPTGDNDAVTVAAITEDHSYSQNDLVYRDYGTGIKLTMNSTIILSKLDLKLKSETADIYVIHLETNKALKLCSYEPLQNVSYSPLSDGIYQLIAAISNGEFIDLTPQATIQVSSTEEDGSGFILLH